MLLSISFACVIAHTRYEKDKTSECIIEEIEGIHGPFFKEDKKRRAMTTTMILATKHCICMESVLKFLQVKRNF
jgi:hypothetical protein